MRIETTRPGSTRGSHRNTGFGAFHNNFLRAAIHRVEGNEIAALGRGPFCNAKSAKLLFQDLLDRFKLRTQDVCVLSHVLHKAVNVLEETDVAQLVDLVVADRLNAELLLDVLKVVQRRRQSRDAAAANL